MIILIEEICLRSLHVMKLLKCLSLEIYFHQSYMPKLCLLNGFYKKEKKNFFMVKQVGQSNTYFL